MKFKYYLLTLFAILMHCNINTMDDLNEVDQQRIIQLDTQHKFKKTIDTAYQTSNLQVIQNLIKQDKTFSLEAALNYAISKTYNDIACFLINSGADLNMLFPGGYTALHLALACHNADITRALIAAGINKNFQTSEMPTPLHFAVGRYFFEGVKILVESGVPVDELCDEFTPLLYAIGLKVFNTDAIPMPDFQFEQLLDMIALLVKLGADVNYLSINILSPLNLALDKQENKIIACLEISLATRQKNLLKLIALIKQYSYINKDAKDFMHKMDYELFKAIKANDVERVKTLYAQGVSLSRRDIKGNTPLHIATKQNSKNVIRYLLDIGADPTAVNDDDGETPVHIAFGETELLKLFMDYAYREEPSRCVIS